MNVFSKMTYTLETLIQAGFKDLRVLSVPVRAHPVRRASRLLASPTKYVLIQGANVVRITALYKPLKIFSGFAAFFLVCGAGLGLYALIAHWAHAPGNHALTFGFAGILFLIGVLTFLMALLADVMAINREFLEELKLREQERAGGAAPASPQPSVPVSETQTRGRGDAGTRG